MVYPAADRLNHQPEKLLKTFVTILSSTLLLTSWVVAELPRKMPVNNYSSLWKNSPFTSRPPPPPPGEEVNPLDDYALIGVSPIGSGGYRVTLINKNQPDQRIMVDTGVNRSGFEILGITRKAGDVLGTEVRMRSGTTTGTVSYDEKLLTIASPQAAPPQQAQPVNPNGQPIPPQIGVQPPGVNQNGQPIPQRQPRPRVVPPPAADTPQQLAQPPKPARRRRN